jgi:hypothetical protein
VNHSPRYRSPRYCPECRHMRWPGDCNHGLVVRPTVAEISKPIVPAPPAPPPKPSEPVKLYVGAPQLPDSPKRWVPNEQKLAAAMEHRKNRENQGAEWWMSKDERWMAGGAFAVRVPGTFIKGKGYKGRQIDDKMFPPPELKANLSPARREPGIWQEDDKNNFRAYKYVSLDGKRTTYVQCIYADVFDDATFYFVEGRDTMVPVLNGDTIGIVMPIRMSNDVKRVDG